jgi:O-antigen/teichoic acid export membrane protein/CelD/BcsL family acetyltransferase involved in cellulose biosynthesis
MSADFGRSEWVGPKAAPSSPGLTARAAGSLRRVAGLLGGRGEAGAARRLAGGAFVMRVVNAGLGFATQIFLARWMGGTEYGIYAYIWVWLLFVGGVGSLGLPVAALKFIPDYTLREDRAGLRGFLHHAVWLGTLPSLVLALVAGFGLMAWAGGLGGDRPSDLAVALIALGALPLYVLTDIQTGIARAYDDADLGLAADYLVRPLLTLAFAATLALAGGPATAPAVMAVTLAAVALTAIAQGIVLQRRLRARVPSGPRRVDFARWREVSTPLLLVTTFTLLLGSTDILLLKLFVPSAEIARYFAATKILAVASFVAYGVAATSSHRFAAQAVSGDRTQTARLARETVRWTFWPTLAVILALVALAKPLLALFGPDFAESWPVIAILSLGLLAQAAVGPADRALAMLDHGAVTARIYAGAFVANIALGLTLIPVLGLEGAALATSLALVVKSALLYASARGRLGLHMFAFGGPPVGATASATSAFPETSAIRAEIVEAAEAARHSEAWAALAGRALEPNVFYRPGLALSGLNHLPERAGAGVVTAWHGEGSTRRLVGLLPVTVARGRHLNPFRIRRAAEFYGTLSTPLLDPDHAPAALDAMLAALAKAGISGLLLPFLHDGGPAAAALDAVCAARDLPRTRLDQHARAMLRSELPGADYVRATLETRRRKEADRQRRRLADEGALAFRVVTERGEMPEALDAFLALEAASWKGKLGTDLRTASGGEAFIRATAAALARDGAFRIATLTLDGRVIAAGLVAIADRRAFYLKTAYDEALARFSPGLLLTLDLTAHLLDDPAIDDADSIAVADHPMIDRIWTERFPVASVLVATRPGGGALFRLAGHMERLRDDVRRRSKSARVKLQAMRQARANATAQKS